MTTQKQTKNFAFNLLQQVAGTGENVFFSPFSISACMALLYEAARGQTALQMADALDFDGRPETLKTFHRLYRAIGSAQINGPTINIANALFLDQHSRFQPDYLQTIKSAHHARLETPDFKNKAEETRNHINKWVQRQTNGRITSILPPGSINELTKLILVNAIYFKGMWETPFETRRTRLLPFHGTTTVTVPMMGSTKHFNYMSTPDYKAIELPYQGGATALLAILPTDMHSFEKTFSQETVDKIDQNLRQTEVALTLPKFKVETTYNLTDTMAALGMPVAFTGAADFSGLDGTTDNSLSLILHKAFVETNEQGTEAAAATAAMICRCTAFSRAEEFTADRPFYFLIREKTTGTILFLGRINQLQP